MHTKQYCFMERGSFAPGSINSATTQGLESKQAGIALLEQNKQRIEKQQKNLYAESKQALLVVLQAMDAAGKDGTVKHVFGGVNPQGVEVWDFKQPTKQDLAHGYLWRIQQAVPPRGKIGVFNRSHYEDVLIAQVLNLPKKQPLPASALNNIWENRYRQIRDFERYLYENGTTVVKIYLHLSKEEQRKRLLARIDNPAKNWKFEAGDLETRERWEEYMRAYEKAINNTAAKHAPWYVVPADHKWYARAVVSQIVADTLEQMAPKVPYEDDVQQKELAMYRAALEKE